MLDDHAKEQMNKYEISYELAREGLAFSEVYPVFHALAERQGVELGGKR